MAVKAGGNKNKSKIYWTGTCNGPSKHGKAGFKSTGGWFFIGVAMPRNKREQFTQGCVACKKEAERARKS
jgi:hypothetical protein